MRRRIPFNDNWHFTRGDTETENETVTLPHTWNARDGQDGGNDYWRGTATYCKHFENPVMSEGSTLFIEFQGAAMTAAVRLNGEEIACHEGGYSTFRADMTDHLQQHNVLMVSVDNGANDHVYPQKADFTFYGGLYRDVNLLIVPQQHFELTESGTPGIQVRSRLNHDLTEAVVTVKTWHNADRVSITVNGETKTGTDTAEFVIAAPRLWNGKTDPYLYTATARLASGDEISTHFGIREIGFDPQKGFLLNHQPLRLCGAARHQDWQGLGSALTPAEHEKDLEILLDMGANTVRLAHYQHDQYFYDLCDRAGLIVWAEIPYITEHLSKGRENTISQMRELVVQCRNHPSIVCWGLSNEITASSGVTDEILENHKALNDLCHQLDPDRPTSMAHVFMLSPDDPIVLLPDIRSYNLYYGWYVGELEQNDQFFDDWHRKHPNQVMGLSEYGADANPQYQSGNPIKGDWTEGYQALYHEHMLRMWSERPYIWAMHCWNGFDFGADGRDEGGKPGQNQKGLVTFDRQIKKDAFYVYKAYLSDDPFVHLCGRRYAERTESETEVKVYSNQNEISLFVDGIEFASLRGEKIFRFQVPISGKHVIRAVSGSLSDEMTICRVSTPNPDYAKPGMGIVNWFDRDDEIEREGYFSIRDSMGAVKANPEAQAVIDEMVAPLQRKLVEAYGDVAKNVQLPPEMLAMMDKMSVEASLRQMGKLVGPEFVHKLNYALNQVRKLEAT